MISQNNGGAPVVSSTNIGEVLQEHVRQGITRIIFLVSTSAHTHRAVVEEIAHEDKE